MLIKLYLHKQAGGPGVSHLPTSLSIPDLEQLELSMVLTGLLYPFL